MGNPRKDWTTEQLVDQIVLVAENLGKSSVRRQELSDLKVELTRRLDRVGHLESLLEDVLARGKKRHPVLPGSGLARCIEQALSPEEKTVAEDPFDYTQEYYVVVGYYQAQGKDTCFQELETPDLIEAHNKAVEIAEAGDAVDDGKQVWYFDYVTVEVRRNNNTLKAFWVNLDDADHAWKTYICPAMHRGDVAELDINNCDTCGKPVLSEYVSSCAGQDYEGNVLCPENLCTEGLFHCKDCLGEDGYCETCRETIEEDE